MRRLEFEIFTDLWNKALVDPIPSLTCNSTFIVHFIHLPRNKRGLKPTQVAAGVVTKDGTAKYTGLHSLRHFYASWCINRTKDGGLGLPPKNVQERLGHATITMTLDRYGHLFRGDDADELDKAAQVLLA
jgi:integrase